jgi:Spy/CpxP family protein refolding chaperone
MMNFKGDIRRTAVVAGLTAALFLLTAGASSAWADRGMTCHSGMGMGEHGHGMGMWKGMGHGMHPHNAAEHFLKMGTTLNLTDDQIKQLTKLRDEYIQKNATAEEELQAAYQDLPRALYGNSVDMKVVNGLLEKIGKLDSQLWHAYAQQLHDIKAMLTADQKKSLHDMWHHDTRGMHGDMPMPHGNMPMHHKGMGM